MPFVITVASTDKDALTRVETNADFQRFATKTLEDCAISFTLRGNAFEGYRFEIGDSKIVDRTSIIVGLIVQAAKL